MIPILILLIVIILLLIFLKPFISREEGDQRTYLPDQDQNTPAAPHDPWLLNNLSHTDQNYAGHSSFNDFNNADTSGGSFDHGSGADYSSNVDTSGGGDFGSGGDFGGGGAGGSWNDNSN
jgi:hypothetical protein